MVASRQRNHFVPISIKQETALFWKSMFLYFGCESKCALFEYRSRRLNIKLFAAVVYFCLVDCYSCMKCKNVRDWKDHEDKNSKRISLNFLSSKLEQMAEVFNCHGSSHGRIQFSCNVSNMHGTRRQTIKIKNGKKDRNNNRHSFDARSLGQFNPWIKCHGSNIPFPPPPLRRGISLVLSIEFSNRICNFLFFFFSVDGIYRRVIL